MARNKYPEETVNRIIDAASTLFLKKGYEKTTIQDIINELGDLSKGAIYHHFKSKEALFEAFATRLSTFSPLEINIKTKKNMSALERLSTVIDTCLFSSHQDLLLQSTPNLLKHPKLLAMLLEPITNGKTTQFFLPIIQDGIQDGSIKTDYPEQAAELLLLFFNIYLNPSIYSTNSQTIQLRAHFVKDLLDKIGLPVLTDMHLKRFEEISSIFNKIV